MEEKMMENGNWEKKARQWDERGIKLSQIDPNFIHTKDQNGTKGSIKTGREDKIHPIAITFSHLLYALSFPSIFLSFGNSFFRFLLSF